MGSGRERETGEKPTTHMSQSFAVRCPLCLLLAGNHWQWPHGQRARNGGPWAQTQRYRLSFRRRRGPSPADADSEKTGPKVGRKLPRVNSLEEVGFLPGKRDLNDSAQGLERPLHPEWDSGSA